MSVAFPFASVIAVPKVVTAELGDVALDWNLTVWPEICTAWLAVTLATKVTGCPTAKLVVPEVKVVVNDTDLTVRLIPLELDAARGLEASSCANTCGD